MKKVLYFCLLTVMISLNGCTALERSTTFITSLPAELEILKNTPVVLDGYMVGKVKNISILENKQIIEFSVQKDFSGPFAQMNSEILFFVNDQEKVEFLLLQIAEEDSFLVSGNYLFPSEIIYFSGDPPVFYQE